MKRNVSFVVKVFSLSLFALSFTGCKALTGLIDAADEFGCPLGKGTNCTTLTATHEKVTQELDEKKKDESLKVAPSVKKEKDLHEASSSQKAAPSEEVLRVSKATSLDASKALSQTKPRYPTNADKPISPNSFLTESLAKEKSAALTRLSHGVKARMPERVMFLWVLPWVDTDGDLHGESRLWVKVRDARWGVEKLRLDAMNRGAPEMTP